MSLTGFEFLLLVFISVIVYYLVPGKIQWCILLFASFIFYFAGGYKSVLYLLLTIASTYFAGRLLSFLTKRGEAIPNGQKLQKKAKILRQKKWVVFVALFFNFGMLFLLKYWDSTVEMLNHPEAALGIVFPLGVSFFIFQSTGYVIDCYRGKVLPEKNPFKYALFVSFFPQMTQGPISRYDQLAPQLLCERNCNADDLKYGLQLMMWGYFKKLMIANRAAEVVNIVFSDYDSYGGVMIVFAVLMYCIQLYCDFSGGIDIIRGVGRLFGIYIVENFKRPIFSTSLAGYWRRWHITLGQWMKDYVFYPMALSYPILKIGKFTRRKIGGGGGNWDESFPPPSLHSQFIF